MPLPGRSPHASSSGSTGDAEDLTTPEEAGQKRRRKLAIIWGAVAVIVIPLGVWGARPVVHAVKGWQARRIAAESLVLMDKGDGNAAFGKLQDALSLRSTEPEVMRAAALLLTRAEHGREAVSFWNEIEKTRALTREEQRSYVLDLLFAGDLPGAEKRLRMAWPDGTDGTPVDWDLRMQIDVRARNAAAALPLAKRLLDAKASGITERQRLNAALTLLSVNSPTERDAGEAGLRALADGGQSPESLEALTILLKQAAQTVLLARDRHAPVPEAATENLSKLAERIEKHPLSKTTQQLAVAQARMIVQPNEREKLIQQVVGRYVGSKDNDELAALGSWLYGQQEFKRLLEILTPERAIGGRTLYLLWLDTLGAVGRWDDIRRAIEGQRFTLDPMVEQMYLARCATQLNKPESSVVHWEAALRAAGTSSEKLLTLGRYAQNNGATLTAEGAFRAVIKAVPENRSAHESLLGTLEAQGRTREAREAIKVMLAIWPQDAAVRNDDAYLGALLNADLNADRDTARELLRVEPGSVPHRVTLALAEFRLGHDLTALETLQAVGPDAFTAQPRFQAVYAAVLWAAGFADDARKLTTRLAQGSLLPEERLLLAPIKDPVSG